jgi:hypothetical protein
MRRVITPSRKTVGQDATLKIRAIGYELDDATGPDYPRKDGDRRSQASSGKDTSAQLTNAEWLMGMPGPDDMKLPLLNCVVCHYAGTNRKIDTMRLNG